MTVQSEKELQISMMLYVVLFEWMLLTILLTTDWYIHK